METELVSSHLPPELNRSPITARAVSSLKAKRPICRTASAGNFSIKEHVHKQRHSAPKDIRLQRKYGNRNFPEGDASVVKTNI
jgi:hypothetical protein